MFNLFSRAKPQPKPEITSGTWADDAGNVLATAEFNPPHRNVWHALLDLSENRRARK